MSGPAKEYKNESGAVAATNDAPTRRGGGRWFVWALVVGGLLGAGFYGREALVWNAQARARANMMQQRWEDADRWLSQADSWSSSNLETQRLWTHVARRRGRLDEARRHLEEAVRRGLPKSQADDENALIQAQAGDLSGALPLFESILQSPHFDATEVFEAYSIGFMQSRRMMRQAFDMLTRWSEQDPQNAQPQYLLARLCLDLEDWPRAERHLRTAVEVNREHRAAALLWAQLQLRRQQPADALPWFRIAAAGDDERLAAQVGEATCLRRLGDLDGARSLLRQLDQRKDADSNCELQLEWARLELGSGELEAAATRLEKLVAREPRQWDAQYELATAWRRLGRDEEARQKFAEVQEARTQLGLATHLTRLSLQNPTKADLRFRIGQIQLRYGDEADGVQWLQGVLELIPKHRSALELLVKHFESRGEGDSEARSLATQYRRQLDALR